MRMHNEKNSRTWHRDGGIVVMGGGGGGRNSQLTACAIYGTTVSPRCGSPRDVGAPRLERTVEIRGRRVGGGWSASSCIFDPCGKTDGRRGFRLSRYHLRMPWCSYILWKKNSLVYSIEYRTTLHTHNRVDHRRSGLCSLLSYLAHARESLT